MIGFWLLISMVFAISVPVAANEPPGIVITEPEDEDTVSGKWRSYREITLPAPIEKLEVMYETEDDLSAASLIITIGCGYQD